MKKITLLVAILLMSISSKAQSLSELNATLTTKKDSIAALQAKATAIQSKIDALPGWRKGAFGNHRR